MILNSSFFDLTRLGHSGVLCTLWVGNPRDKCSLPANSPSPKCGPSYDTADTLRLKSQVFFKIADKK